MLYSFPKTIKIVVFGKEFLLNYFSLQELLCWSYDQHLDNFTKSKVLKAKALVRLDHEVLDFCCSKNQQRTDNERQ
jgi:hypothetical protein